MARAPRRVKSVEKLSAVWVILISFCVGLTLAILAPSHPPWLHPSLVGLLYLFLEFLPLLLFIFTISQPILSPYLLLPWIILNTTLLLFSSILLLSLSIPRPTLEYVILCLILSIGLIFPIITGLVMYLPLLVFIRRRFPSYKKKIRNTKLYRRVTNTKSAKEIEAEILARRQEQIRNTIITDKSYEQFIYVSRAANKWKRKVEKRKEAEKILDEVNNGNNVTVNAGYGLEPVVEETRLTQLQHDDLPHSGLVNGGYSSLPRAGSNINRIENGKMVTDV